ncbi:MAG: DMT family transporter [Hyphomicrobiaceae bacterium]
MSLSQWLYLILLSVLWGGSFFFVGVAVHDVPMLTLVFFRVGLAAAFLWPIVAIFRHRAPTTLRAWSPFVIMAVLNNIIPFSLITLGQRDIASGLASVLNATTPLWTVLIAHAFTHDEKLTANKLAGVILGVVGVAWLMGPEAVAGQSSSVIGMLCVIAATISYGFAGLWGRRLRETPPLVTAACQLTASALLLAPVMLIVDQTWTLPWPPAHVAWSVVGLAVLSTALAYIVFFHVLAISGPTNVMLVTLLIPVSAILLGTLILNETLLPQHLAGAGIIASALLIFDGRLVGWLRRRLMGVTLRRDRP